MTYSPTPLLAAFWMTQSPGANVTNSESNSEAVGGFTVIIANCSGSPTGGKAMSPAAGTSRCEAHVPDPTGNSTRCPTTTVVTPSPRAATRPMPSLPPTAGSGGSIPYWPVSVSTSDGLIGAASISSKTSPVFGVGVSRCTHSTTS